VYAWVYSTGSDNKGEGKCEVYNMMCHENMSLIAFCVVTSVEGLYPTGQLLQE